MCAYSATRASARWIPQQLWETTMDPEHRTLLQVTMEDAAAADETFALLMGEKVESQNAEVTEQKCKICNEFGRLRERTMLFF